MHPNCLMAFFFTVLLVMLICMAACGGSGARCWPRPPLQVIQRQQTKVKEEFGTLHSVWLDLYMYVTLAELGSVWQRRLKVFFANRASTPFSAAVGVARQFPQSNIFCVYYLCLILYIIYSNLGFFWHVVTLFLERNRQGFTMFYFLQNDFVPTSRRKTHRYVAKF